MPNNAKPNNTKKNKPANANKPANGNKKNNTKNNKPANGNKKNTANGNKKNNTANANKKNNTANANKKNNTANGNKKNSNVPVNKANNANLDKAAKQLNKVVPAIKKGLNTLSNNDPDKSVWKATATFLEEHNKIIRNHKNSKSTVNYVNKVNTFVAARKNLTGNSNAAANNKPACWPSWRYCIRP
jgi:hypothetical protein